ncbi:3-ketoacyl-CoA thiolase, peroxisomal isoform X4 [Erinaceus europaeus]|uniref:acetyl-CoA C-acetyltransferase n=1 Tax=Erinaceus europaeus TaxID=9365 RepID=A0ABM3WJ59_ERIEU|nr:3-ketoacyl-CoA thiolase, peroxisomal isoform X4 [Erinaceus europaeus]
MRRLQVVLGHLKGRPYSGPEPALQAAPCLSGASPASPEDVVVVHGRRTAIGRAGRGGFKVRPLGRPGRWVCTMSWESPSPLQDTTPDELLSTVLTAVLQDVKLSPVQLGDICVGNVLQPGAGAVMARIAQFLSDIPETVPLSTVNRQCSSGLQAVASIAGGIRNGSYDIGMACGVESMSLADRGNPGNITSRLVEKEKARDCLIPMGITSENVAERFGISREKQDAFALASQQKAARAQSKGFFQAEIVPVTTMTRDDKGNESTITVSQDEGIRPNTTMEGLAKLKPSFKKNGSSTAGNSSQVSDGAAAILLARRSKAEELGLPILGVLRSYAVVGVPPDIMGIGPAYAIPEALQKAGLTVNDVDIFEINEAFASQAVYCVEKLGIPPEKGIRGGLHVHRDWDGSRCCL